MKITAKQYAQALYEETKGKNQADCAQAISHFIGILERNRHLALRKRIIDQFRAICDDADGVISAKVTSREALDAGQISALKEYIKKSQAGKEIVIENEVDAKILGGIIVRIADSVQDSSVRGLLGRLRQKLAN